MDIVSALLTANYLTGPYAAIDSTAPVGAIVDVPFANVPEPDALVLVGILLGLLSGLVNREFGLQFASRQETA